MSELSVVLEIRDSNRTDKTGSQKQSMQEKLNFDVKICTVAHDDT